MKRARDSGEELGDLLRRFRTAAGLTQEELAERAAISARTVSDIERGLRNMVYRETAKRLAEALDLEAADREEFEKTARRGAVRKASRPSRNAIEIGAILSRLPSPLTHGPCDSRRLLHLSVITPRLGFFLFSLRLE